MAALTFSVLSTFCLPDQLHAEFTDAHSYDNTPKGINQIELSYAYVRANASIDDSLAITGAELNLNQVTANYTHYFGLANHLMWVNAGVPLEGLNGQVSGTSFRGIIAGAGDSSYQVAALLKGGACAQCDTVRKL